MSDRLITLLLVDDDPIFGLGLATALSPFSDLRVIAQAETPEAALERLAQQVPDILVLEPALRSSQTAGWQFPQQLKQAYPGMKVCLLSGTTDLEKLLSLRALAIEGYFPKGIAIEALVQSLRQLAAGESNWQALEGNESRAIIRRSRPGKPWLSRLRQSGLGQIEASLTEINLQINNSPLPLVDRLFWQGRQRELLAARWLVKQILPVEVIIIPEVLPQTAPNSQSQSRALLPLSLATTLRFPYLSQSPHAVAIFEHALTRVQLSVDNLTEIPLEIDILQVKKKQELLAIVIEQLGKALDELQYLQVVPEQLPSNPVEILQAVWQASSLSFFGKYCAPKSDFPVDQIKAKLENYASLVEAEVLEKIPLTTELFAYFLCNQNLVIERVAYRPEAPETIERAERLLDNAVIQIANGVMVFILNNFSDIEEFKQILYYEKMISSRAIAEFRNHLSWRYRLEKYWKNPQNIFESRYRLFFWCDRGITTCLIYSPRQRELEQLQGIPWAVTILLEAHDAIAPRLRAVVAFIGNGLVYLLTQVIGRGIGLIGRGIIQGIGNTFQETRYRKNNEGEKPRF